MTFILRMEIVHIIIFIIATILVLEVVKHFFFKKTAKVIMFFFVILILFLAFSYTFKNVEKFQDNHFIQTGAVITGEVVDFLKEKVDTKSLVNSTVKSNKLFKS